MVCKDCEKKLAAVIVPDKWKDGSKNAGEERKVNENKALGKRKMDVKNFNPYSRQCKICKSDCHQKGAYYCQNCAYKKGICSMCGKKVLDVSMYKQSSR